MIARAKNEQRKVSLRGNRKIAVERASSSVRFSRGGQYHYSLPEE